MNGIGERLAVLGRRELLDVLDRFRHLGFEQPEHALENRLAAADRTDIGNDLAVDNREPEIDSPVCP